MHGGACAEDEAGEESGGKKHSLHDVVSFASVRSVEGVSNPTRVRGPARTTTSVHPLGTSLPFMNSRCFPFSWVFMKWCHSLSGSMKLRDQRAMLLRRYSFMCLVFLLYQSSMVQSPPTSNSGSWVNSI